MPQRIEHIDALARKLQRDVLFVVFHRPRNEMPEDGRDRFDLDTRYDWESCPVRGDLIAWLEAQGIGWQPCGHFASTSMMVSYLGQVYIDLPYQPDSPSYQQLEQYLELPDGSMRFPNATFCLLELTVAMQNAAHDEPGFWDRWAETF